MIQFLLQVVKWLLLFAEVFDAIATFLKSIFKVVGTIAKNNPLPCGTAVLVCFALAVVNNPDGAINTFMITIIDLIVGFFPSTPEHFKTL
jgi:hypothetical protein